MKNSKTQLSSITIMDLMIAMENGNEEILFNDTLIPDDKELIEMNLDLNFVAA